MKLARTLTCEFLGTAFLLATVVGSGILGDKLDAGNMAVTVLAVAFATGTVLAALILTFESISCHLNPVVTLVNAIAGKLPWRAVIPYIAAQVLGAVVGVAVANMMFELPPLFLSDHARTGPGQWLGEFVATFGLVSVILGCGRARPQAIPAAVAAYVAGAIWFTSSTCFANPAVSLSRAFTGTVTGIRLADVPAFIAAELAGALAAYLLFAWLLGPDPSRLLKAQAEKSTPHPEAASKQLVSSGKST